MNKYRQLLETNSFKTQSVSTNNTVRNTLFKIASLSKKNNSNFKQVTCCKSICFNCRRPGHFSHSCRRKRVDNHWFNTNWTSPPFECRQLDNWRQKPAYQIENNKKPCSTECQMMFSNYENYINKSINPQMTLTNSRYLSSCTTRGHYCECEEQ